MPKGFIVHPYETSDGKYHASFGDHNKTVKSFDTLKGAKKYLLKNKVKKAIYDSPSTGHKEIELSKIKNKIKQKRASNGLPTFKELIGGSF